MEGHRYADDPEPSWYAGPGQYARPTDPDVSGSHAVGPYDSGVHERPSGAFRLPEQRPGAGPYGAPDPVTSTGSHARPGEAEARAAYDSVRVPVRGPEYPTVRPTGADPAASAPASGATTYGGGVPESLVPIAEPTSLVPPVGGDRARFDQAARPADSVYQTRRPISSFIVAGVMVVLLLPVVRLLLDAT